MFMKRNGSCSTLPVVAIKHLKLDSRTDSDLCGTENCVLIAELAMVADGLPGFI